MSPVLGLFLGEVRSICDCVEAVLCRITICTLSFQDMLQDSDRCVLALTASC